MQLDQHFTDNNLADKLVHDLISRLDPMKARYYIEPSCGGGAFVQALQKYSVNFFSIELDPQYEANLYSDFLQVDSQQIGIVDPNLTVVIGNPPFGKAGKLARDFINHASTLADWICFVVPRSMSDARNCGKLNPSLQLMYEIDLPKDAFSDTKAACVWQEWYKLPEGLGTRPIEKKPNVQGLYQIVGFWESHDIVIQRCGMSLGRVTSCNGTGEGKYYIRSPYSSVLEAFRHLEIVSEDTRCTHQGTLSFGLLHTAFEQAFLKLKYEELKHET
jgi:hypothetical protein